MPDRTTLKHFYDEFHKEAKAQTKMITPKNFTYHIVLNIIGEYLQPKAKVLDVGCGTGPISLYLASQGNSVTGIDVSQNAINVAQASADVLKLKNVSFLNLSFPEDSLAQQQFDFITCIEVLDHIPNDRTTIERIFSLLSPNGVLVLSVSSRNSPIHRLRMFLKKQDSCDKRVGHLRRYNVDQITKLVRSANLSIIKTKRTEGLIRNFFFVTKLGNKLLRFVRPPVTFLVNAIDCLALLLLGESQIFVIAKKEVDS